MRHQGWGQKAFSRRAQRDRRDPLGQVALSMFRPPDQDHLHADDGLGRFLALGKGLGSVWGCVLRTACASIS